MGLWTKNVVDYYKMKEAKKIQFVLSLQKHEWKLSAHDLPSKIIGLAHINVFKYFATSLFTKRKEY